jgi:hypothetical protein
MRHIHADRHRRSARGARSRRTSKPARGQTRQGARPHRDGAHDSSRGAQPDGRAAGSPCHALGRGPTSPARDPQPRRDARRRGSLGRPSHARTALQIAGPRSGLAAARTSPPIVNCGCARAAAASDASRAPANSFFAELVNSPEWRIARGVDADLGAENSAHPSPDVGDRRPKRFVVDAQRIAAQVAVVGLRGPNIVRVRRRVFAAGLADVAVLQRLRTRQQEQADRREHEASHSAIARQG